MKKKFYLSIDLEEWYHLLYFKKYTNFRGEDFFIFKINEFLNFLNNRQIKATFFVLAELAKYSCPMVGEVKKKNIYYFKDYK